MLWLFIEAITKKIYKY